MRLPRVRFGIHQLMLAVAAIAFLFPVRTLVNRWPHCGDMIRYHSQQATRHREMARLDQLGNNSRHLWTARHHDEWARKWRRFRLSPWAIMEPDPADPLSRDL